MEKHAEISLKWIKIVSSVPYILRRHTNLIKWYSSYRLMGIYHVTSGLLQYSINDIILFINVGYCTDPIGIKMLWFCQTVFLLKLGLLSLTKPVISHKKAVGLDRSSGFLKKLKIVQLIYYSWMWQVTPWVKIIVCFNFPNQGTKFNIGLSLSCDLMLAHTVYY